jgi:GTPase SAR1 family protein
MYVNNEFPTEFVPTVFENKDIQTKYENKLINLRSLHKNFFLKNINIKIEIWDSAGQSEFDTCKKKN